MEQLAGSFLEKKGYRIITYNFKNRYGEIDIIAMDAEYLVFVEVKYRNNRSCGYPQEAVDFRKQKKISLVADEYCRRNRLPMDQSCRFDVVSILGSEVTLIKNAYEYCGNR